MDLASLQELLLLQALTDPRDLNQELALITHTVHPSLSLPPGLALLTAQARLANLSAMVAPLLPATAATLATTTHTDATLRRSSHANTLRMR